MLAALVGLTLAAAPPAVRGESCDQNMACCCPDDAREVGIKASASSVLDGKAQYGADKVLDRDGENYAGYLETAWCEGKRGGGEGEWLRIEFPSVRPLQGLLISAGYDRSPATYFENGRLKTLVLTLSDGGRYTLRFGPRYRTLAEDGKTQVLNSPQLFRLPKGRAHTVKWLKLQIAEVEPGKKFTDTCISTVVPHASVEE